MNRQRQCEFTELAFYTVYRNASAHGRDDFVDKVQPQAEAGHFLLFLVFQSAAVELFKDVLLLFQRNAPAVIPHPDEDVAVLFLGREADGDTFVGILQRIVYQVAKGFLQVFGIGCYHEGVRAMGFKGYFLVGLDPVFLRQLVEQGRQADRFLCQLQARLLQLGDGQNFLGQIEQVGTLFVQDGEILFLQFGIPVQQTAFQRMSGHGDGGDGRLHVVNHGVGEVLPQAGYPVLANDDAYLIDDASGHEYQQQGGSYEQDAHLPEGNPIRVQDGGPDGLCMFPVQIDWISLKHLERMFPDKSNLFLKRRTKRVDQLAFHLGLIPFLRQAGCKNGVGQRQGDG